MRAGSPLALAPDPRNAVAATGWFATLSPGIRHDLLRTMQVRRYEDGDTIFRQGERVEAWLACGTGAVRISGVADNGRALTLAIVGAGRWFGDPPISAQDVRSHDAQAHGATCVLAVSGVDLQRILDLHPGLYPALLRLQALRLRQVFKVVDDLGSLGLGARLGRQLLHLSRTHGVPCRGGEVRIGLRVRQDVLAEMLGCSRQRLNQHLGEMMRAQLIRREAGNLVVRDRGVLERWVDGAGS
ncbi:MAG: transcriptional regulator, Crp/Fnr family [Ramlibacter sp.]|jgi:CRP-like cAMP-binding protein|nr:transcriptional regulator, Crp/Fnr family [Ramlibacter sp.]